ncbi:hypothetical protein L289_3695 [Acinetobacter gerneri DSM 14967 = CIP 107464 = MTCC 9824]|uniref:DUF2062 domain-containing protein n=2 Tax=Acinetobacter gerneri TaxID=202952 RepID=N8ZMB8_9GAMM|nr:hypothetical protein F960_00865 [Acinetobacter gerneri DSM 14967 = CIP 107464 = MTCC 9824]EPR81527.1 hypothetical protein L289_3695 [Acinetobacter gerneri DSM 14967 = CIP 107464 = MTCC 9824]
MTKRFFRDWLPSQEKLSQSKILRIFGDSALNPVLWYVNKKSISRAMLIGTFWGMLPIPFHSILIVICAILFDANLPISLMLAWIMNPFTILPILYIAFWMGTKIYHVHMINKEMLLGVLHQIVHWIKNFGHGHIDLSLAKILLTGMLIEAFITAVLAYFITKIIWNWKVIQKSKKREKRLEPPL